SKSYIALCRRAFQPPAGGRLPCVCGMRPLSRISLGRAERGSMLAGQGRVSMTTADSAATASSATAKSATSETADWRSPVVIVVGGCLIAMLAFGPRSALGFFLTPLSAANGWGRDIYALAIAVQSLLYGAAQPFAGALADGFGPRRVIVVGGLSYALG